MPSPRSRSLARPVPRCPAKRPCRCRGRLSPGRRSMRYLASHRLRCRAIQCPARPPPPYPAKRWVWRCRRPLKPCRRAYRLRLLRPPPLLRHLPRLRRHFHPRLRSHRHRRHPHHRRLEPWRAETSPSRGQKLSRQSLHRSSCLCAFARVSPATTLAAGARGTCSRKAARRDRGANRKVNETWCKRPDAMELRGGLGVVWLPD
jgi:hypothetical protein